MNTLQTWVLLRLLIVFAMATLALVLATLLGSYSRIIRMRSKARADAVIGARLRFASAGDGVWRIQGDRVRKSGSSNERARARSRSMKTEFQTRNPMEGHNASSLKPRVNSIAGLLSPEDILLDLDAPTSTRVFEEAGRLFERRHGLPRARIVQGLLERESLGSTGLGLGIALPHARIDELSEPAAAFVTLKVPIPFDAPDAKPVSHLLDISRARARDRSPFADPGGDCADVRRQRIS